MPNPGVTMPSRQAWSGVGKYRKHNVQLSSKTKHFAHLGMINLCLQGTVFLIILLTTSTSSYILDFKDQDLYLKIMSITKLVSFSKPVSTQK